MSMRKIVPPAVIGFLIPFACLTLIALALHQHKTPVASQGAAADSTHAAASATTDPLPSAEEVAAANRAILSYCTNDLRQDTNCTLIANSNVTAPGFVESGVRMSGYFEGASSSTDGSALAKGSGDSWQVIWVGQGCIPKNVSKLNNVAPSLDICAS